MFQKKHKKTQEQQSGNWRKRQTQERKFCVFLVSSDTICVYICVEDEAWGLQRGSERALFRDEKKKR